MRRITKPLLLLAFLLLLGTGGALAYIQAKLPDVGASENLTIEPTPQRLARGKYLGEHVAGCIECHSKRDWNYYGGPVTAGTEGQGGERFDRDMIELPGILYARNITPAGLKDWTDGDLLRAITTGETHESQALFPLMPYDHFGLMEKEDAYALVAYVRSLKPISHEVPARVIDFPMNFILRTIPRPARFGAIPDSTTDSVAHGRYLANIADCVFCHTPSHHGELLAGREFSGGVEFHMPWGTIRSANITPDKETGLGDWTREDFIEHFKTFAPGQPGIPVEKGNYNTIMPWSVFGGLTDGDLGALYDYLRTQKPVKNDVVKYTKTTAAN